MHRARLAALAVYAALAATACGSEGGSSTREDSLDGATEAASDGAVRADASLADGSGGASGDAPDGDAGGSGPHASDAAADGTSGGAGDTATDAADARKDSPGSAPPDGASDAKSETPASDASVADADASADTGSAETGSEAGAGDASNPGDALADGYADAVPDSVSDGGLVSDPGVVMCGSAPCDSNTSYCCNKTSAPPSQTCILLSAGQGACFSAGGDVFACDEATDCDPGEKCYVATNAPLSTTCSTSGGLVLCKNDGDCALGTGPCVTQTCNTGIGRPQVLSTCGGSGWCTANP